MTQLTQPMERRHGLMSRLGTVLALCVALAACDDLLEVELPGQVTESGTFVPAQARLLVNSAIADIECALSDFTAFESAGYEDWTTRTVGWWGGRFERPVTPNNGGTCSPQETSVAWFAPLHKGRWMAEQVYDRLANDGGWAGVEDRDELLATAAIYAGIAYTHLGEFFCEVMADSGPPMTWQQALAEGEQWFTTALGHIGGSDFSIDPGITTSAEQMAYLLRARARFFQGTKDADAASDAAQVTQGFIANVSRDAGAERARWNRVYSTHVGLGWSIFLGPVDWWSGTNSNQPDFLGGGAWPAVIPFTGTWDLGVVDDLGGPDHGRAVTDTGHPITLADAGAVADPRVVVEQRDISPSNPFGYPEYEQRKYNSQSEEIAMAKWEEAWLLQALVEGGQTAIDLVNDIRTAQGLPTVDYLTGASPADDIQIMVLEEYRRNHFIEPGRWWSAKLRYDLWFPRGVGSDQWNFGYQTGVRMVYPTTEYQLNPNLTEDDQGSFGCSPSQNPVV